jgi:hypothetical protein
MPGAGGTTGIAPVLRLEPPVKVPQVAVGRADRGRRVIVLVADIDIRILSEDGELFRRLALDPTKDYQPIASRP